VWISEDDAKANGIVDNDWVEVFNVNGTLTARVVVSQRVPRHVPDVPRPGKDREHAGAEITGMRGGIHNSVTRAVPSPPT
jgi:nitrate reductase alpha subunit